MRGDRSKPLSPSEIEAGCANLFDVWCERRAARPLRHLLTGWPMTGGLTDDWATLYEALRAIKAECRGGITDGELERVEDLMRTVATVVFR